MTEPFFMNVGVNTEVKLTIARKTEIHWGPPLLLPGVKLRNISSASRFKIAKRIILTNTTVHISVEK
jgi:hypothetical protein